ncbi:MAG: H(+)-transporting ATPase [Acidobacteria bacterium]|nr:MAG: H(+)-transporting ATPase [Acidobacteriota bacterium]
MPATTLQIRRGAKLLFRWCFADGRLDEDRAREAVRHVLQSKRRGYLAVLGEFKRLVKLDTAKHTASVQSAVPLQADLQSRLRTNLEAVYGERMTAEFAEDPDLIGGIRVRVANDVYDGSVKARLAALARSFGIVNEVAAVR